MQANLESLCQFLKKENEECADEIKQLYTVLVQDFNEKEQKIKEKDFCLEFRKMSLNEQNKKLLKQDKLIQELRDTITILKNITWNRKTTISEQDKVLLEKIKIILAQEKTIQEQNNTIV